MAIGTGYDQSVRQYLNNQGIDSSQIKYDKNTGQVMVNNTPFIKPEKVYQGTSYSNQSGLKNAWDAYSKSLQQPTVAGAGMAGGAALGAGVGAANAGVPSGSAGVAQQPTPQQYNPYSNVQQNPYTSQTDQIIQSLLNYGQNQQNFDPYSSSAYQAAQEQAQRASQQGIRAAQEAFGSAGFGRSTGLGERAQRIGQEGTEYLMTQVLPQIEAQEQARRQQEFNNIMAALNPLLGQQGRADDLVQRDFSNAITQGQLTGSYLPPEAQQIIDQLVGLKQQAETRGITAEQRTGLSQQADVLRGQLQGMGMDPAMFGANVSAAQAGQNRGQAGITTLGGRAQDLAEEGQVFDQGLQTRQQDLDETQTMAVLTGFMPDGTPTNAKQQQDLQNLWAVADATGTIPNQLADLYGIPRGTQTQAAKQFAQQLAISQQNANTSAFNAKTSRMGEERLASEPAENKPKPAKVDAKTSANNLSEAKGNVLNSPDIKDKSQAMAYAQGIADYLSDSDYRALLKYIDDEF